MGLIMTAAIAPELPQSLERLAVPRLLALAVVQALVCDSVGSAMSSVDVRNRQVSILVGRIPLRHGRVESIRSVGLHHLPVGE